MKSRANKNQFGVDFYALAAAETVTLGPAGVAALGDQGNLPWAFLNPPGASDELTGMDAESRYNYGIYADKFAMTRLDILRQIESRWHCR